MFTDPPENHKNAPLLLSSFEDEIMKEAQKVVDDYAKNPSKISGSAEIRIHENSPWLDENKPFIPVTKKNVDKKK